MKFLKSALLAAAIAVAACNPRPAPLPPTKVETASVLKEKTVALVRDNEERELRAYCTGVWVSDAAFLSAHHCIGDGPLGTRVLFVVENDVFEKLDGVPWQYLPRERIRPRSAVVTALDPRHDLALLHSVLPVRHGVAKLARQRILPGQLAQQVGQSLGLWWSYSSGDIGAVRWDNAGDGPMLWVQTTVPTSPGNSGGGIFNAQGELIGICHGTHLRGQNINIFIHPIYVEAFLDKQGSNL